MGSPRSSDASLGENRHRRHRIEQPRDSEPRRVTVNADWYDTRRLQLIRRLAQVMTSGHREQSGNRPDRCLHVAPRPRKLRAHGPVRVIRVLPSVDRHATGPPPVERTRRAPMVDVPVRGSHRRGTHRWTVRMPRLRGRASRPCLTAVGMSPCSGNVDATGVRWCRGLTFVQRNI